MDDTHNARTCIAIFNCDCGPTGILLGVNRDSQNCSQNRGTASKLSRCRGSSFPDENQGKLYRISSDNATEARIPDQHGVQNENSKAAETSQTESTSDSVAAMAKRSNSLKVQPGKPGCAHQLTQRYKYSAKAVDNNGNPMRPVKENGAKLPPASGQVLWAKVKTEPPKYSSKSSSRAWKVKEKKEPSKDSSNLSSNMRSSDQVHEGQPSQKSKCSADAVNKSRNQTQAIKKTGKKIPSIPKQEKETQEPSKGPSIFLTKISSSDQARWGQPGQRSKCSAEAVENRRSQSEALKKRRNQLPTTPKQVWQVKRETLSSQEKGKTSSKIRQAKKKISTLSSRTSSSHAKRQRPRSLSPEHHIKCDDFVKLGHNCFLCENDLAHSPLPTDKELESDKLPDVAILPCGHAFHTLCLEQVIPEYDLKDPSCFICASLQ